MPDPARNRYAIVLGFVLMALIFGCCLITLLGWTRGAIEVLSLLGP